MMASDPWVRGFHRRLCSLAKGRVGLQRLTQSVRILYYKQISSANVVGYPSRNQPLHAVGKGTIVFEPHVTLGYFASPFFMQSVAYLEARESSARIQIGAGPEFRSW